MSPFNLYSPKGDSQSNNLIREKLYITCVTYKKRQNTNNNDTLMAEEFANHTFPINKTRKNRQKKRIEVPSHDNRQLPVVLGIFTRKFRCFMVLILSITYCKRIISH